MKTKFLFLSALAPLVFLSACSTVKEQAGLSRRSPDEFTVVDRAPLTLPPGFDLRPPQPGAERPQEVSTVGAIQEKFGMTPSDTTSNGTQVLLSAAGADKANPDIRRQLDAESKGVVVKDKGFVDRLVNYNEKTAPDPIVDPEGEKQRIQDAKASGKSISGDQSVIIERQKRAPLEGIF